MKVIDEYICVLQAKISKTFSSLRYGVPKMGTLDICMKMYPNSKFALDQSV